MALSIEQFQTLVVDSGLLSMSKLQDCLDSLPPQRRPKDGNQLADELVRQKLLTAYQAQQICDGTGESLVLGNYLVLDKLGEGGMGVVFKAEHQRMNRIVALKILSPSVVKKPELVRRFQREVKAAAKLEHPNIVAAYDADEVGETNFLVMQFVDGTDLATLVNRKCSLPLQQALQYVMQVAKGLEYAHANGVVHRDIKPSNMIVDRAGIVKILDFGLARIDLHELSDSDEKDPLTHTGQVMGTWDYISPEQALNTSEADHRSDIYSLGCTLYRFLAGRPPYKGKTIAQVLFAHRESPIPSLRDIYPETPLEVDRLFRRMLAKNPDDRQQSMTEVIAELAECIKSPSALEFASAKITNESVPLTEVPADLSAQKPVEQASVSTTSYYYDQETDTMPKKSAGRVRNYISIVAIITSILALVILTVVFLPRLFSNLGFPDGKKHSFSKDATIRPEDDRASKDMPAMPRYEGAPLTFDISNSSLILQKAPGGHVLEFNTSIVIHVLPELDDEAPVENRIQDGASITVYQGQFPWHIRFVDTKLSDNSDQSGTLSFSSKSNRIDIANKLAAEIGRVDRSLKPFHVGRGVIYLGQNKGCRVKFGKGFGKGSITQSVRSMNTLDGETFRIHAGNKITTFEFEDASLSNGVSPGNMRIAFHPDGTDKQMADGIISALKTFDSTLQPVYSGDGRIFVTGNEFLVNTDKCNLHQVMLSDSIDIILQASFDLPPNGPDGYVDGDRFTIRVDSKPPVTFEFDKNGKVLQGNVAIDISDKSANNVAEAIIKAINSTELGIRPLVLSKEAVYLGISNDKVVDTDKSLNLKNNAKPPEFIDGSSFTISQGVRTQSFEFDRNGNYLLGKIPVAYELDDSVDEIATAIRAAIYKADLDLKVTNMGNGRLRIQLPDNN